MGSIDSYITTSSSKTTILTYDTQSVHSILSENPFLAENVFISIVCHETKVLTVESTTSDDDAAETIIGVTDRTELFTADSKQSCKVRIRLSTESLSSS